MAGLLDFTFRDIDKKDLDREKLLDYLKYLEEIMGQGLPIKKEDEYQSIRLRLLKRLNELNREQTKSGGGGAQ